MKRIVTLALSLLLLICMLPGCGQSAKPEGKISVVCTIFPQYDWVRQILGDRAGEFDLSLLLGSRADLHNYQPSVDDIVNISKCDLFIYVGGESDGWVEDALAQAVNADMVMINLLDVLGDTAKLEEHLEDDDGHHHDDEDNDDEELEYDEHVWLSLKNARTLCFEISQALIALDGEHGGVYHSNWEAYNQKLREMDEQYQAAVDAAPIKTLLFGDRFPFRYLADDYGIQYDAAFPGCSAEAEASFDTIVRLAKKADAWGLHSVMVTESADKSIAGTIIENTTGKNQQILVLDAMQSVTMGDVQGGMTYLSIMESNLGVLKEALK